MDAREKWREVRALDKPGSLTLGPNTYDRYVGDPRRIGFMMARYAAAAKFLKDSESILEIGCGDGFGTWSLFQNTDASVLGIDFDSDLIGHAKKTIEVLEPKGDPLSRQIGFEATDFLSPRWSTSVDGICSLDVIEHLEPASASAFFSKCRLTLNDKGVAVFGTPNQNAAQYASAHSNLGHINLYDADRLESELGIHFERVWILSMNDSVVHLGFPQMAHYLLALCVKSR